MTIQRFVVLSGLEGKVLDAIAIDLRSRQIATVLTGRRSDFTDYMFNLQKQMLSTLDNLSNQDTKIVGVLCSALSNTTEIDLETRAFFPLVRRYQLDPKTVRDLNKVASTVSSMVSAFSHQTTVSISQEFKKPLDDRLLLPVRNVRSNRLRKEMDEIYNFQIGCLSQSVNKDIARLKKSKKLRVDGIDFEPAINNAQHPIRRCSDTVHCDLSSQLRFGFRVQKRFEFDVTCEAGLVRKRFYLCDGTYKQIKSSTTHLNMRINDDFEEA